MGPPWLTLSFQFCAEMVMNGRFFLYQTDTFIQSQKPLGVLMNTPLNGEKQLEAKLLTAPFSSKMVSLPFNAESN